MKKITLFLIALIATLQTQATHIVGGQITTRCIGGLTQEITVTLFRDMQGIPALGGIWVWYQPPSFPSAIGEIATLQPGSIIIAPNIEVVQYIDTITLPFYDTYNVFYSTGGRVNSVNIPFPSGSLFYINTTMIVDSSCNSSPIIPILNLPLTYVNSTVTYNIAGTDPDNDSLSYSLVFPKDDQWSAVMGYTFPPNMTISSNGIITFSPSSVGTYTVCVKISEYRNGIEIGSVIREMIWDVLLNNSIEEITTSKNSIELKYFDLIGRKIK